MRRGRGQHGGGVGVRVCDREEQGAALACEQKDGVNNVIVLG